MIFVEVIVTIVPLMLFILGLFQMMLLQAGKLAVMRAANASARAAVVVLDDDPRFYGGEPRNQAPAGSQRLEQIRRAAAGVLVAVQPGSRRQEENRSVGLAISTPRRSDTLPGLLTPSADLIQATKVTLSQGGGSADEITVEVQHEFRCVVPMARSVLCPGGRTRRLHSRATLTNQRASYEYGGGG